MLPIRGRRVGAAKQWKIRRYCCHGTCNSNTADCDINVKMLPFPKPCSTYFSTLISTDLKHDTKKCVQCAKARHWIHLCKRADSKLQKLTDINGTTYICSKHFVDPSGPTEIHPDPFPADQQPSLLERAARGRKRPADRGTPPKPKRHSRQMSKSRSVSPQLADASFDFDDGDTSGMDQGQKEIVFLDHRYYESASEDCPSHSVFKKVAEILLTNNIMTRFDNETINFVIGTNAELANEYTCSIDRAYELNIRVYGINLPKDHVVWQNFPKCFDPTQTNCYTSFMESIKSLQEMWKICKCHIMVKIANEYDRLQINPCTDHGSHPLSSPRCHILSRKEVCESCRNMQAARKRRLRQREKLKERKNLRYLTRSEALICVRKTRKALYVEKQKTARLRKKIAKLIKVRGMQLPDDDNADFLEILANESAPNQHAGLELSKEKIDLTRLFFHEQIKAAKAKFKYGHRWHPLMLKWCLYLKTKSSSTYSAHRNVLTLPSEKRLFQIQAHTHINSGFQEKVIEALVQEFAEAGREDHTRYCSLLYKEMKIHEDLVFKSSTNELIGFVQLSNIDQEPPPDQDRQGKISESFGSQIFCFMLEADTQGSGNERGVSFSCESRRLMLTFEQAFLNSQSKHFAPLGVKAASP